MSDWRTYGDVPFSVWERTIRDAGGPALLAGEAAWQAAKPHSALALAMLKAESSYGTDFNLNTPGNQNPLNLRPPSGDGYMRYPSYPAAMRAWRERITSPDYKQGIYAKTKSLEDLIHVYAPSSDNNNEAAYVAAIERLFDQWGVTPKETPMPDLVFGKVTHPAFIDRPISKPEGKGQNDLGQRTVKGVVWHRILGTLWGTDSYFRGPVAALTDYGVGVLATDGEARDGQILRWNDPLGRQSGWASGPVNGAYGDGLAFVNTYGIDAVNRDQASIEISGNYDTPLSEQARESIAALTAYWADQAELPWDVFPIVPGDGFSFVRWHQEFTLGTGKVCPGPVVMGETSALIERARQIMRAAQTGGKPATPPAYAAPELPAWFADSLTELHPGDQTEDGVRYRTMRRNFKVKVQTTRRSKPDPASPVSGPKLPAGELLFGERLVEANGKSFLLTNDGHYVLASKLSPRVRLTAW